MFEAMWLMLQDDDPGDFVIATNETHSIREFLELAFESVDLNWQDYVEIDQTVLPTKRGQPVCSEIIPKRKIFSAGNHKHFPSTHAIMVESDCQLAVNERLARETANSMK